LSGEGTSSLLNTSADRVTRLIRGYELGVESSAFCVLVAHVSAIIKARDVMIFSIVGEVSVQSSRLEM